MYRKEKYVIEEKFKKVLEEVIKDPDTVPSDLLFALSGLVLRAANMISGTEKENVRIFISILQTFIEHDYAENES